MRIKKTFWYEDKKSDVGFRRYNFKRMSRIRKTTRPVQNQVASNSTQPKNLRLWVNFFDELCKEYECLQHELKIPDKKVNTIGLKRIQESSYLYGNIDTFLTDINLLARSYMIHFKKKSPMIYNEAESFKEICHKEAYTIKKCPDCYESWMNDKSRSKRAYFERVCPKPHLLVFMKVDKFPNWPAKLFYVKDGMANVACFGRDLEDDIPISQCFLYSYEILPGILDDKYEQKQLNLAYKEVKKHIELIEEEFGPESFIPAPPGKPVSNLDQHLKDMFPDAYA